MGDIEAMEEQPVIDDYQWPAAMRFDVGPPYKTHHFYKHFRTSSSNPNSFLKGVKWSPDGSCFLTSSDDNTLSIFTLPDFENCREEKTCSSAATEDSFPASLAITEGEAIYDYCWYPYMSTSDPVSCVFATTTRDHPIHLWDTTTGKLRCTYRAYDNMDEITAAFSIGFNPTGTKIFAGYNKSVRIFDIHRPGRDFEQRSTIQGNKEVDMTNFLYFRVYKEYLKKEDAAKNEALKKTHLLHQLTRIFDIHRPGRDFEQRSTIQGNKEGQSGIISSIAFSPSHTGMVATGSYSQTTAIHREDNMEILYVLHGQEGGVTQVQFSKDGNYLYTGGRKDPYILCWDIRNTVEIVYKLYRSSETTNQRIQFDIDPYGRHLGTGGQDGLVHIYDLQTGQWVSSFQAASDHRCRVLI
nr:hypothetical protein [Tanacetum cinerariifolium]